MNIYLADLEYIDPNSYSHTIPLNVGYITGYLKKTQDTLRGKGFSKFVYLPLIIIVLSLSTMFFTYTKTIAAAIPRETKTIGEWIKSNTSVSDLVIVPKEWFDERFYLQYYSKRIVRNEFPENLNFSDNFIHEEAILIVKKDKINMYNKKTVPMELNTFKIKDKKIIVYGIS